MTLVDMLVDVVVYYADSQQCHSVHCCVHVIDGQI